MYPLQTLEHLLDQTLSSINSSVGKADYHTITTFLEHASAEAAKIKDHLLEDLFIKKEKREAKVFLQTFQAICIDLSDKLFSVIQCLRGLEVNHPNTLKLNRSVNEIRFHLEDILLFIQQNFYSYFDLHQKIPKSNSELLILELRQRLKILKKHLFKYLPDTALIDRVLQPVLDHITSEAGKNITFQHWMYLKEYVAHFEDLVNWKKQAMTNDLILNEMVYMNVTDPGFINYYVNTYRPGIEGMEEIAGTIEQWAMLKKNVLQLPVNLSFRKKDNAGSAPKLIAESIDQELYFLERLMQLNQGKSKQDSTSLSVVKTKFSVAQLALFTRLLVDTGVIECTNQTTVLKLIANTFKTDRAASISAQSLRVKYYESEKSAIDNMKDQLITMMNRLRQY